jgi:signal transduction histidine kinase
MPFHLMAIGFAVLYGFRIWPADPMLWGLGIVIITTFAAIGMDVLHVEEQVEEIVEMPLMATMFTAIVWHANRRIAADHDLRLVGEKNARLLSTQRRFLQDASHYLSTPITIALTHAELLARDLPDGQELRDVQMVVGELTRIRRLSERLLVIAASEDPDFLNTEPIKLDKFMTEIARRWRPTAQRCWQLGRLDAATVRADPERLALVLDALLENAVRNTPADAVIELSVSRDPNGEVRMIIRDSGTGIPADELAHVFDRFRTGRNLQGARGTGLGLALVRAVAHAHGGEVRVFSEPGKGSEFEFILPAAAAVPVGQPAAGAVPVGQPAAGAVPVGQPAVTGCELRGADERQPEDPGAGMRAGVRRRLAPVTLSRSRLLRLTRPRQALPLVGLVPDGACLIPEGSGCRAGCADPRWGGRRWRQAALRPPPVRVPAGSCPPW